MARGGINKAIVQKARKALLARGEHPSIDAVRIEMGNTGSKTTIHRYLKELDAQAPTLSADKPGMSEMLSNLVSQLAQQLVDEGDARIAAAQALFEQRQAALHAELDTSQQALTTLQQQHQIQAEALAGESAELATTRSTLQSEQTRNATLNQAVGELNLRLADKDEQIQSLEDKHLHARDALEHYRTATREQRDQDQRRHEAQVQQVQVEVRQLQQSLIVKQDELTRLNRDNERLLVEARQVQRERQGLQDQQAQQALEIKTLMASLAQSLGAREELLRQNQLLGQQVEQGGQERQQQLQLIEQLQRQVEQHQAAASEPEESP